MSITPEILPRLISAIDTIIAEHADEVTALDQIIGDGDHVTNLQRGLHALHGLSAELTCLSWDAALQKIGMSLMSTVGGASGSLYGTLFITLSKSAKDKILTLPVFAEVFTQGVEAMKKRGKSDAGEKTMLDVLIPVALHLQQAAGTSQSVTQVLNSLSQIAIDGMQATRDMLATKGRASFLGERSKGHVDAGAKTAQLMICSICQELTNVSQ